MRGIHVAMMVEAMPLAAPVWSHAMLQTMAAGRARPMPVMGVMMQGIHAAWGENTVGAAWRKGLRTELTRRRRLQPAWMGDMPMRSVAEEPLSRADMTATSTSV